MLSTGVCGADEILMVQQLSTPIPISPHPTHSIIYQRGIYPPEMFKPTVVYGITVMVASDPSLVEYMSKVLAQMKGGWETML